jgi:hypothetical protein
MLLVMVKYTMKSTVILVPWVVVEGEEEEEEEELWSVIARGRLIMSNGCHQLPLNSAPEN